MKDEFSGLQSVLSLSQSKAEHVRHGDSYGFRVLGKGDMLCILKTLSS